MYDTARRVELVKRQIRKNTRRRQKRGIGRLSAVCMLLFAALMQTADRVVGQGQTAAWGGFVRCCCTRMRAAMCWWALRRSRQPLC